MSKSTQVAVPGPERRQAHAGRDMPPVEHPARREPGTPPSGGGSSGYRLLRPLLFRMEPERAHERALALLRWVSRSPRLCAFLRARYACDDPRLAVRAFGRTFAGPLGVAAGFDKNGVAMPALLALGFGCVEVGTVTPRPQPGNPRPRLFRLAEDRALVNRLGFPGAGLAAVGRNLARTAGRNGDFGLNIGPNKERVAQADEECALLIGGLSGCRPAYFVVNVSSPNTARLRELQGREALRRLLAGLRAGWPAGSPRAPLLLKIAPDLSDQELDDILDVATEFALDGIVATNTTVARPGGLRGRRRAEQGGLSGAPLAPRSLAVVRRIYRQTAGRLPIIAAGGIATGADALVAIAAGATLVQAYAGFVYEGPGMAGRAARQMAALLERRGVGGLDELRGQEAPR